jgi:hypothetical protein
VIICKSVLNIGAGITVSAMTNARMFNLANNITATGTPVITLYAPLTAATAILGTLPSPITVVECYTSANPPSPPTTLPGMTFTSTINITAGYPNNAIGINGSYIRDWADVATYYDAHTLTHRTNIIDYTPQTIGCFCESTGEIADNYDVDGVPYTPTLDRACDAIVKIKPSTTLNSAILGIITDDHTFANSGDVLCVVVQSDATTYAVGDMLTPDSSGLCRKATDDERRYIKNHGLPRVRITALFPGKEFVACFIQ